MGLMMISHIIRHPKKGWVFRGISAIIKIAGLFICTFRYRGSDFFHAAKEWYWKISKYILCTSLTVLKCTNTKCSVLIFNIQMLYIIQIKLTRTEFPTKVLFLFYHYRINFVKSFLNYTIWNDHNKNSNSKWLSYDRIRNFIGG